MDADFSVSTDSTDTDFLVANLTNGQTVLTLQILNSVKGTRSPAIILTSDIAGTFFALKAFAAFLVIAHEIGHIYYQHNLGLASYFRPESDAENVEVQADEFALSMLQTIKSEVAGPITVEATMGIVAALSYRLRHGYGAGIAELYFGRDKNDKPIQLNLKYSLFDVHPPVVYRLLSIASELQRKHASEATNPYLKILDTMTWTWKIL